MHVTLRFGLIHYVLQVYNITDDRASRVNRHLISIRTCAPGNEDDGLPTSTTPSPRSVEERRILVISCKLINQQNPAPAAASLIDYSIILQGYLAWLHELFYHRHLRELYQTAHAPNNFRVIFQCKIVETEPFWSSHKLWLLQRSSSGEPCRTLPVSNQVKF